MDISRLVIRQNTEDPAWSNIVDPVTGRSTNVPTEYLTDVLLVLEGKVESFHSDAPVAGLILAIREMDSSFDMKS